MQINITPETASILRLVLLEYINTRTPVREYVDKRYAHMDEAFRNHKIGTAQYNTERMTNMLKQLERGN
jgi:hypothetical protein